MFGRKKPTLRAHKEMDVEHVLGYILVYRGDIIPNKVFVDKERELHGMIGFSVRKLSDELDCVALLYAYRFFIEAGETVERLDFILSKLFDRFVKDEIITKEERQPYYGFVKDRVHEYLSIRSTAKIGMTFMNYVVEGHNALTDDTGRYVAPVLRTLEGNIRKRISAELAV